MKINQFDFLEVSLTKAAIEIMTDVNANMSINEKVVFPSHVKIGMFSRNIKLRNLAKTINFNAKIVNAIIVNINSIFCVLLTCSNRKIHTGHFFKSS